MPISDNNEEQVVATTYEPPGLGYLVPHNNPYSDAWAWRSAEPKVTELLATSSVKLHSYKLKWNGQQVKRDDVVHVLDEVLVQTADAEARKQVDRRTEENMERMVQSQERMDLDKHGYTLAGTMNDSLRCLGQ